MLYSQGDIYRNVHIGLITWKSPLSILKYVSVMAQEFQNIQEDQYGPTLEKFNDEFNSDHPILDIIHCSSFQPKSREMRPPLIKSCFLLADWV